jgi:hypothetical protein
VLGEKVGETTGKVTGQRVLDEGKLEITAQETGKLLGLETSEFVTYSSELREGGVLYGEGRGVAMTREGDHCSWRGSGIGKLLGRGMAASYRGSIFYQAEGGRFSRLNGMCVIFEYQVDENGNTKSQLFEWK